MNASLAGASHARLDLSRAELYAFNLTLGDVARFAGRPGRRPLWTPLDGMRAR